MVERKAKLVLNKLTVEKFDKLSDEFVNVGYTSKELLQCAINIVVEKAQMEHHFGPMYASLCRKMATHMMEGIDEEGKAIDR